MQIWRHSADSLQARLKLCGNQASPDAASVILPFCLLKNTIRRMKYELSTTKIFDEWFQKLDRTTRNKLLARFDRIGNGNFGDHKTIENNLFELRCFFDGGIRIYYTIRDHCVVLLLSGGDKSSQTKDIEKVRIILEMLGD